MPIYNIRVIREDIYSADVPFEAESPEDAMRKAQGILNTEGWDALCGPDDGDYCECTSTVEAVECPECRKSFVPNKTTCKCERTALCPT